MKAILEFNLDDVDDRMAHKRCVKADNMAYLLWEFLYNSRKKIERSVETDTTAFDAIDMVYKELIDQMGEFHVDIDELVS